MRRFIVLLILAGISAGVGLWHYRSPNGPGVTFWKATVERGHLLATISATGTIQPEEVVDVGAQVAGQIKEFGADLRDSTKPIDYGSSVEQGTVLARIDDAIYVAESEYARAQLEQALANVQRAEADLEQAQVKLSQAERDWARAQQMKPRNAISQADYEQFQTTYETAKASLSALRVAVVQAQRGGDVARAALKRAETNLGYTTIKSPIAGVIIDRRVNIGQTVVANLNAPSLFLIAKDLKRMEVWASVNEADIGSIHKGQSVRFTVDAYADEVFRGEVAQIRLNASMTQNVVTYTVVVYTDNSEGKLLPYLTANLQFVVAERSNALLVANAALRWQPQARYIGAAVRERLDRSLRTKAPVRPGDTPSGPEQQRHRKRGTVWVEDGAFVRPVKVTLGLSDDTMTEILGEDLKEETEVVVGEVHLDRSGALKNPFTPQVVRDRKAEP